MKFKENDFEVEVYPLGTSAYGVSAKYLPGDRIIARGTARNLYEFIDTLEEVIEKMNKHEAKLDHWVKCTAVRGAPGDNTDYVFITHDGRELIWRTSARKARTFHVGDERFIDYRVAGRIAGYIRITHVKELTDQ